MEIIFEIKNLNVKAFDKVVLKGVNLKLKGGEVHAVMGPNGIGKSTLASSIMGNPKFQVTNGQVFLNGEDILKMQVDERAKKGIFLSMQNPSEVSGITNLNFLKSAVSSIRNERISPTAFIKELDKAVAELKMKKDLPYRYLNDGFSGGEKKINEILQMLMLKPKVVILDEIDSGLDMDALKIVADTINKIRSEGVAILIITHYQRILDYVNPSKIHVLTDGKIVKSGGKEIIEQIEKYGYDAFGGVDE